MTRWKTFNLKKDGKTPRDPTSDKPGFASGRQLLVPVVIGIIGIGIIGGLHGEFAEMGWMEIFYGAIVALSMLIAIPVLVMVEKRVRTGYW
ncbi:MAG: hypothetical protein ACFFCS_11210 [Candidatus Hodarchaeota archaeon]